MLNIKSLFLNAALFSLLFSINSHGYIPESGHSPITRLAMQGYQSCTNSTLYSNDKTQQRLLQGNVAMDHGTGSFNEIDERLPQALALFHVVERVTNWHFYNPQKSMYSRQKRVEMSHDRLWAKALVGFEVNNEHYDKWLFLGALLHLTEDLSVPAHVVPVYHGPTVLVNWLGEFENLTNYMRHSGNVDGFWLTEKISDPIDAMPPDINRLTKQLPRFCKALKKVMTPEQIRQQLTAKTLQLINQAIKKCGGLSWQLFWREALQNQPLPAQNYFGQYNINAGFPLFGQSGSISDDKGKIGCSIEDFNSDDSRYEDFIFELHQLAIIADMNLLLWAQQQVTQ
jgi:hypothetical protein